LQRAAHICRCIINELKGVNRVCSDNCSEPPAMIEWKRMEGLERTPIRVGLSFH
jgi:GMP synthase C terminal domain